MALYRDVGVVVRTHKLGESDRVITLVTQDSGKVKAVAKGVRKTGSRFGSRLEPMSHVQLQLYRGRDLDIVNQVELIETATAIRASLELTTDGLAMCEVIDQLSHERAPAPHLYRMLVGALRQLELRRSALVLPALQLRLLATEGVGPIVERCVGCSAQEHLVAFDVRAGGMQCRTCRRGITVAPPVLALLQAVLGGRVAEVLADSQHDSDTVAQFVRLGRSVMEHHLERRIKSSSLFEAPRSDVHQ